MRMRSIDNWFRLISLVMFTIFCRPDVTLACEVRKPAWAGRFYPADAQKLKDTIAGLTQKAQADNLDLPPSKMLRALILPHAGYMYSGWTAAYASAVLSPHQFEKVVLLGPDHRVGFSNGAITDCQYYETPFGRIKLHPDQKKLLQQDLFRPVPASDQSEHALEVVLPFLQYYLKAFELLPAVLGPGNLMKYAAALDHVITNNTLVVVSSDLSHFLSYEAAVEKDKETIAAILALDLESLLADKNSACGTIPIAVLIELARRNNWQPALLHYSNSGDTAGDRAKVVGYAAIAFYGGTPMAQLSSEKPDSSKLLTKKQGQTLIKLARQTIAQRLGVKDDDWVASADELNDPDLKTARGTFVTLTMAGQLRGCIGSLAATEPIMENIRKNAVNAAFYDPRFAALKRKDLKDIEIEVSILTDPKPLQYSDAADLLNKITPHQDGVIIRKKTFSATFLPQVWEQLPQPEMFLSHLCRKAGLSSDAWKNSDLKVFTYRVQYFHEKR
jgi:AmmeMemoRadiSam system protein B/AmmeMemoRadiSam system protein A